MNMYRGISQAILDAAIDGHQLSEWYGCLSDGQKEKILSGLDERICTIIAEHSKELDQYASASVILGSSPNYKDPEENFENKERTSNRCKAVPKHKVKEDRTSMGIKIVNNTDLSDDEVRKIGCELVDRFSDLLGM